MCYTAVKISVCPCHEKVKILNNKHENKEKFEMNLKTDHKNTLKALSFNRSLLMENFIIPNRLKFPLFRNILENYFHNGN